MNSALPSRRLQEEPSLQDFLEQQKAGVLAVPIDNAGTIHAAALLYAFDEPKLRFLMVTSRETEKCALLSKEKSVPASMAIGTEKGVLFSLQMRGSVSTLEFSEAQDELDIYQAKFGRRGDMPGDQAKEIVLVFTPNWARYTSYEGKDFRDGLKRYYLDVS